MVKVRSGEKVIRVGFDMKGDNVREREVIKVNGRTGMENGAEGDKRSQLSCWPVCLISAHDHANPFYPLIKLYS